MFLLGERWDEMDKSQMLEHESMCILSQCIFVHMFLGFHPSSSNRF